MPLYEYLERVFVHQAHARVVFCTSRYEGNWQIDTIEVADHQQQRSTVTIKRYVGPK